DREVRIGAIQKAMEDAVSQGLFKTYDHAYVYVERTLLDGSVRQGVVGAIDLETYDYRPDAGSQIRATEKTVVERIPPRMAIRKDARLELSHVLLLCNDDQKQMIEPLAEEKDQLPLLYDFDLMQGGGHISGWLLAGGAADAFDRQIEAYEKRMALIQGCTSDRALLYAVGDGNHSLATAKECYEAIKCQHQDADTFVWPARYAMVELGNVYSDALSFEPIHRILKGTDPAALLEALETVCAPDGTEIEWVSNGAHGTLKLDCQGRLPVALLQSFLDDYMKNHPCEIDYIHGEKALETLAMAPDAIGFLLPSMHKEDLFPGIVKGGVLPRKTFSMGHAEEKRYYLEARSIRND
ncbi:MAG: DUF1015 domain-containing protein, partial [Clostridia bacterium]|nr:DUF1015 domain-containing protein [Clostridia bacterium]